jgi:hypothetical protein
VSLAYISDNSVLSGLIGGRAISRHPEPQSSSSGWGFCLGEVIPMRRMTQEIVAVDAQLRALTEQLHDNTWDPDELGCIRDEIDDLLDQRLTLSAS